MTEAERVLSDPSPEHQASIDEAITAVMQAIQDGSEESSCYRIMSDGSAIRIYFGPDMDEPSVKVADEDDPYAANFRQQYAPAIDNPDVILDPDIPLTDQTDALAEAM